MRNHYVSPKQRLPKINYDDINSERRGSFVEAVEEAGTIGEAMLQIKLGFGDGIFERIKRRVLELYKEYINFNSKTKIYTAIKPELEKPTIEVQCDWVSELWRNTNILRKRLKRPVVFVKNAVPITKREVTVMNREVINANG